MYPRARQLLSLDYVDGSGYLANRSGPTRCGDNLGFLGKKSKEVVVGQHRLRHSDKQYRDEADKGQCPVHFGNECY